MREIKFRGKSKGTGRWLYGHLFRYGGRWSDSPLCICCTATISFKDALCYYEVDKETVGQYTGFKDYYGREIYEGDVISSMIAGNNPVYHVIFWHPQSASFRARLVKQGPPVDHCGIHMEWINKFHKEVIGNVYDNKEFLEEE